MTMRDRLAADLMIPYPDAPDAADCALCGEPVRTQSVRKFADSLIALGWVRLDEEELTAAKHDYAAKMLAIAREGGVLVTEERLALALHEVKPARCPDSEPHGPTASRHMQDAAAIIRALREEP